MTTRGRIRVVVVLTLAMALILVLLPLQIVGLILFPPVARWVPVFFHKCLTFLFGIRVSTRNKPSTSRPLLIISNHVSWVDIIVLSSVLPLSFVAKAEMIAWPIFGQLAQLQRTIFVRREERRRSGEQASEIAERLQEKDVIVLFPEGTTSDGHELYPFKTALFEAARFALVASEEDHALIQPVALSYSRIHGLPIGRQWRQQVAWPGDVGLGEHFLPFIAIGAVDVTICFGEPILFTPESNRKEVAAEARQKIRAMLQEE